MTVRRLLGLALAGLLAAGCAGSEEPSGRATLWVTRDRGERVVLVRTVPAGITAMQALEREADVETRYGGRFVQSIEGIEGNAAARRDWFYFVNGVEADRSATEYRLRAGDVEWWDFRSWRRVMRVPVVVGAFPEPFLNGYAGERRLVAVRYWPPQARPSAEKIGRLIRADSVALRGIRVAQGWSTFTISPSFPVFRAWGGAGGPVHFGIDPADARRLARDPTAARFRYRGLR